MTIPTQATSGGAQTAPDPSCLLEFRNIRIVYDNAIEAIRDNEAVYLMAVGGAAYLVSKAIKSSRVLAFADLGMEAIYEFDVNDMPVTVAVDSKGTSVHTTGPAEWSRRIAGIPILQ